MEHPLSRRRALILSVFAAITVNTLKFHPRSATVMDSVEAFVARYLPIPKGYGWVANVVLFVITTFLVYAVVKSLVGVWCYNRVASLVRLALARAGKRRMIFGAEERTTYEFKQDVLYSSKHSKKMYCLLVSAYTMAHEEEQFMLGSWLKTKELRILLLDRRCAHWQGRAKLFIDRRLGEAGRNVDDYKAECEIAEKELKEKYHAHISFYDEIVRWRLYVFDDRIFVSRYWGPPEADFGEARDAAVVAFSRAHPMYDWLYGEFYRLAPEEWKRAIPKPAMNS
jgi:hypothetical protein